MSLEQSSAYPNAEQTYNTSFHKLMRMFTISVVISFLGTYIGTEYVPRAWILPLVIVEFIMLISSFFIRRSKSRIGYAFTYAFCFISGITLFPAIQHYTAAGGTQMVQSALLVTAIIFIGLTTYAYLSKRDFSFLRGFLLVGLLTLIGFSLVSLFIGGFSGTTGVLISVGGVLIFSGYILYDISNYRNVTEEEIPLAVLNLYLDFINLFLYVLRLFGFSKD